MRAAAVLACSATVAGCGSAPAPPVPTTTEMARLRSHLADALAAGSRRDRAGAIGALNAMQADVRRLRGERRLSPQLAATLSTDLAQATSRATIDLPAPAATGPTIPAAAPAVAAAPQGDGGGPGKQKDHGGGDGGD